MPGQLLLGYRPAKGRCAFCHWLLNTQRLEAIEGWWAMPCSRDLVHLEPTAVWIFFGFCCDASRKVFPCSAVSDNLSMFQELSCFSWVSEFPLRSQVPWHVVICVWPWPVCCRWFKMKVTSAGSQRRDAGADRRAAFKAATKKPWKRKLRRRFGQFPRLQEDARMAPTTSSEYL